MCCLSETTCHDTQPVAPFHLNAADQCGACKGKCLVSEKKTFEVHIEPGMKNNHKITLSGEAGCSEPGLAPGKSLGPLAVQAETVADAMGY